jgi:ketosteroid isomerase-like protein
MTQTTAAPAAWEQEIRARTAEACAAFLSADIATLDRIFADELIVNSPLNEVATKARVLGLLESGRIRHTAYEAEIERITRHGDVVVVMGRDRVEGPPAGGVSHRRFTDVWRLDGGAWRMIARHAHTVSHQPA